MKNVLLVVAFFVVVVASDDEGECTGESPDECQGGSDEGLPTQNLIRQGPEYGGAGYTAENLVKKTVKKRVWKPNWSIVDTVASDGKPVILTNTFVKDWPAMLYWTPRYLMRSSDFEHMTEIKTSKNSMFFDLDPESPMLGEDMDKFYDWNPTVPFEVTNMTGPEFFEAMYDPDVEDNVYWFGSVNSKKSLKADLEPSELLWKDPMDEAIFYATLWVGSKGPQQHTHFDSDHNLYTVVSGKKKFTLFSPTQLNKMYVFPRVHPMWHKSQVDFNNPDLEAFPDYAGATAYEAIVGEGEVLYVPPYWWHHVETLEPTVAVAAWSKGDVFTKMSDLYNIDLPSDGDLIQRTKLAPVELFRTVKGEVVYGKGATRPFIRQILEQRYSTIRHHFVAKTPEGLCQPLDVEAFYVAHKIRIDLAARFLKDLKVPAIRHINVVDYLETLLQEKVGAQNIPAFLEECFWDVDDPEA